jgi:ATP-dependent protease HslVU (ClpYQ) peptidase subunit
MTTIVAVQYKDKCVIAADNQVTGGNGRRYNHPDMKKIAQRGAFLIAGSGEVQPCDVVQHMWNPPKLTAKDSEDIYHFMITKAMPSLRKCLSDNGYDFNEGKGEGKADENRFNFILAVGGEVFDVADDLSVCRSEDGIYGVGSGSDYAIGALHAGAKPKRAVEIAAKLDVNTSGPIQVVEQYK